jgi:hypothetical protein
VYVLTGGGDVEGRPETLVNAGGGRPAGRLGQAAALSFARAAALREAEGRG